MINLSWDFLFSFILKLMYYFYVLYSLKDQKLYKGYSSDIASRFLSHNQGGTKSTKHRRPLLMIYLEIFGSKEEAMKRPC